MPAPVLMRESSSRKELVFPLDGCRPNLRVSEYFGGAYFGVSDGFLDIDGQALLRHTGVTSPYDKFRIILQQYDRRQ
jgi:hypothetical protein